MRIKFHRVEIRKIDYGVVYGDKICTHNRALFVECGFIEKIVKNFFHFSNSPWRKNDKTNLHKYIIRHKN